MSIRWHYSARKKWIRRYRRMKNGRIRFHVLGLSFSDISLFYYKYEALPATWEHNVFATALISKTLDLQPHRSVHYHTVLTMRISFLTFFSFALASIHSFVHVECPTCPATVHQCYTLGNQTNGVCFYNAPRLHVGFECAYWVRHYTYTYICRYGEVTRSTKLTGQIEAPTPTSNQSSSSVIIPPSSPLCPTQVPLTEADCSFYKIGGVSD